MAIKIERAERPTMTAGAGKIQRRRPTDPDFDSMFDEGDGNPLEEMPEYDGDIQSSSDREMSAVEAEIEANRSVIGGKIHGNLVSPMQTVVEETAEIIGDIRTDSLTIAEKAVVHGFINMAKDDPYKNRLASLGAKKEEKPQPAAAPAPEAK